MKEFKLSSLKSILKADVFKANGLMLDKLKLSRSLNEGDQRFRDRILKEFQKCAEESQKFVVSNNVIKKVMDQPYLDTETYEMNFNTKKLDDSTIEEKSKEYLPLPFSSIWLEGESSALVGIPTDDGGHYFCFGILVKKFSDHYYISAYFWANPTQNVCYNAIFHFSDIENDTFETPTEKEWFARVHHILELVTKHKKLGYIYNNKPSKIQTPKGVKKINVSRVINICLKEEGVKIVSTLKSKHIEFSHEFPAIAHWRYFPNRPDFIGKDPMGNRNQEGRTWVNEAIKGKGKPRIRGQIRHVNEYKRICGQNI